MPASTGTIRAGRAFVELFADDSGLVRGLKRASAKLKAFGTGVRNMGLKIAGLGTLITAPMVAAAKSFADSGARLWDMSKRTGIAVEALSALDYMAAQTGSSLEGVERGVRIMQKSITGAADAAEGTSGSLEHLGLTAADLVGKGPLEQLGIVAARLRQIADPTERAAAAMKVFGRSGTELLPMIDQFEKLHGEAKGFGLIRSTESARQAKEFSDATTLMGRVIKSAWGAVGSAIIPILQKKAEWVTRLAAMVRDWIKQNQTLVVTIFQIAAVAVAAGTGLAVLGVVVQKLGMVLGIAAVALKVFGAVLGFLLSPIGLVIAGAAALGGYLLYVSGAGGKAADWLGQKFVSLKDEALAAFGGISDALAAGDIGQAARIVWLTLKMWWTKGVSWISGIWQDALLWCKVKFAEAWGGIRIIFTAIGHGLTVAWIETTAFLSKTWTEFCGWVQKAWAWAGLQLTKLWNNVKAIFSDFDAEAANRAAEQAYEAKKREIEAERDAKLKAREDQRARERAVETREFNESLSRIVDETEARKRAFQTEHDEKVKQSEEELAKARKEWQDSIKAAKDARKAKEDAGPGKLQGPDELLDKLKGVGTALGDAVAKVSVVGTFNPAAILALQAGNAADRTAKASEETAKNTRKLVDKANESALAFA